MEKIMGYPRAKGRCGIRNHLAIIPASVCASETAKRIGELVPGSVVLAHQHGCCHLGEDYRQTVATLAGLGKNPNVGAVLVIGLGCEGIQADVLANDIRQSGKPVEMIVIQEQGGTLGAVAEGARIASRLMREISCMQPVPCDISELILALECGGSDPTSGIAANPAVGAACNLLIADGGSAILSETTEIIGAEHLLAERCVTPEVKEKLLYIVKRMEDRAIEMGENLRDGQPTPGNKAGGITTIEEKSLGCLYKAGSAPVLDVLEYAEDVPASPNGLYVMDTPGQDIDSITGMLAGGAQIVVFTTGRGTPTGSPIAPVLKVTGNGQTYRNMQDNIDVDASAIISGGASIESMGEEIYRALLRTANGHQTKAESLGHKEFGIFRVGYTF